MDHAKAVAAAALLLALAQASPLLDPGSPEMNREAPASFRVRLETTKGPIDIDVNRDWAPRGADRFYNLVRHGYYDGVRFHRVIAGRWAQFGINGDPAISNVWREAAMEDDPFLHSNVRGTIAYAFAVKNGRTTQVFFNLRDNSETHDREPFVPFGRVVSGMEVVDSLYEGYGESSGGGIRAGNQGPLFERGDAYLDEKFPRLDRIVRAAVLE